MLNKGSDDLDKILTMGRTESQHRGLGFQGFSRNSSMLPILPIKFVSGGISKEPAHVSTIVNNGCSTPSTLRKGDRVPQTVKENSKLPFPQRSRVRGFRGCGHCGREGH